MAKQFLTGLNLNKNELLNARIQNLASAPSSPVAGQIYYNTGDNTLRYYNGTSWLTLAQGGSVTDAINAVVDALTTDDIEEGASNLYYTTGRAQDDAANLLTSATLTNISITGTGAGLTITAENGVDDATTDDLDEGISNLYFTNQRALDATSSAYDASGSAATAYNNATSYTDSAINGLDTDDIEEGISNLYYSDARARLAVDTGDSTLNYNSSTGEFTANTAVMATVSYVDQEISDLGNAYVQADSDLSNTLTTAYQNADNTLSNTLTTAYQNADNTVISSLTQDFQDADNTVLDTLRGEIAAATQGLDVKNSVRAATTENITLSGTQTIDGVAVSAGNRVLVKNQSTASENGIYVAAAGSWSRADDAGDGELSAGSFTFVEEGTVNGDSGFVISTNGAITVGTTGITWTQFSGTGQIVAGDGITKTGATLSVTAGSGITVNGSGVSISNTYSGQASIDTVGTITSGTWEGSTVEVAYGGTGATSFTAGEYLIGDGSNAITTVSSIPGSDISGDISGNAENVNGTVAIANGGTGATTAAGARANLSATTKYAASNTLLNPTSNVVTWTVTHSLNTSDVTVQMRDLQDGSLVEADVAITNANTVTISWVAGSSVSADSYRVVVVG